MKILFSCVSDVDPFTIAIPKTSDLNDPATEKFAHYGSMLRLVRYLHNQEKNFHIVLFLTKNFSNLVQNDLKNKILLSPEGNPLDRYTWGISQISPDLIKNVRLIHSGITAPNEMDQLSKLTEEILSLRTKYPNAKIIFNTSSGTPQMQTVLHLTARDMENTEQYQIDGPNRKIPKFNENWKIVKTPPENYLLQIGSTIENKDMEQTGPDPLVRKLNLSFIKKYTVRHELEKLVSSYQYNSAWELCEHNPDVISEPTKLLVKYGFKKQSLRFAQAEQIQGEWIDSLAYPETMTESERNIVEFLMLLHIHKEKGELHEFIFKMTPMLVEIAREQFEKIFPYEKISAHPERGVQGTIDFNLCKKTIREFLTTLTMTCNGNLTMPPFSLLTK